MVIYGTGALAACLLLGSLLGSLLGRLLGIEANVGGVGFAMLMLIAVCERMQRAGLLPQPTQTGIRYWSAVYVPIVVAMAASQNVMAALNGGLAAVVAGLSAVAIAFAAVPLISRLGDTAETDSATSATSEASDT